MEAEVTIWTRKKKKKMKLFRRLFQSRWCYITDKHSLCWDGRWRVRPKFWSHQDSSEPEWWWGWWLQWPHPGNRPIQQCSGKTLVYYIKNSKRSNFLLFPLCDFTLFCASTMWMNIWLWIHCLNQSLPGADHWADAQLVLSIHPWGPGQEMSCWVSADTVLHSASRCPQCLCGKKQ